jgi:hypothetical protein
MSFSISYLHQDQHPTLTRVGNCTANASPCSTPVWTRVYFNYSKINSIGDCLSVVEDRIPFLGIPSTFHE